jgi:hypothetical protein
VFDVSGTLLIEKGGFWDPPSNEAQPGVTEMLAGLKESGLFIIAASNQPVWTQLGTAGLRDHIDKVVEKIDVGKSKPSPDWIKHFVAASGAQPHEMLYVGDRDHDAYLAANGPMIYAHAMWARPASSYGLRATSPKWVELTVRHIFSREDPWFWKLKCTDSTGRPVDAKTLIDADGAGSPATKSALIRLLKHDQDKTYPEMPISLREYVMLSMLGSVYHDDLFGGADWWTTYPGHSGTPNKIMGDFLTIAAKFSREKYVDDLFIRHKVAINSRAAWEAGGHVGALGNQLSTVKINDDYRDKIEGRRILLLDNFLTRGYSTEAGRALLLNAGVKEVIVACVGKYGHDLHVVSDSADIWDSFEVERPGASSFPYYVQRGNEHFESLGEFARGLDNLRAQHWH